MAAQCGNEGPCEHQTNKKHLPQSTVLILMAIVMLFAFSERALATFEGAVFPRVSVPKAPSPSGSKNPTGSAHAPPGAPPATEGTPASPMGGVAAGGGVVAVSAAPTGVPPATGQSAT
jgi:hypothetical protein